MKFPFIARRPESAQVELRKLTELPSQDLDNQSNFQVDVHSADLSDLDLRDRAEDLFYADFDSRTVWPKLLPNTFHPSDLMELGKNPGLGLRKLHQQGITGKNVGIGIIDAWTLLVDHIEYQDRLRFYEEMPPNQREAQTHFGCVVSTAVGKNVGVAPGADLYVVGVSPDFRQNSTPGVRRPVFQTNVARAIDRLLEVNRSLPQESRIRAIAIPMSFAEVNEYTEMVFPAIERARQQGIFLVSCSVDDTYREEQISFNKTVGMGRHPRADPDLVASYGPAYYSEKDFALNGLPTLRQVMLTMDSRGLASATGPHEYIFIRHGGSSWVAPYAAGLYALCCQVKPEITPVEFWKTAMDTGDRIEVERRGAKHHFGMIVNPERLLKDLGGR